MTTVTYKTVAGHEICADVHSSKTEGAAVLFIHGGALIFGNRMWISAYLLESYKEEGLTVVSIDYRLAPETKLPEIVTDVEDAYAWMRTEGSARFGFDPDRIGVVGGSAGGYLTLLAGTRFRPLPRALVSFYGYGDLTGPWYSQPSPFYNQMEPIPEQTARAAIGSGTISEGPMDPSSGRSDFYLYCRQQGIWPEEISGHHPSEVDWFSPFEPLRNVSATYPPTLLLHGEADTDVPFEQSVLMAEQLATQGVAHDFVSEPEWGHAFDFMAASDPKVRRAVDRALAFLVDRL
jgi:acetyl esterase/lipase